jgi:hypothetical protein
MHGVSHIDRVPWRTRSHELRITEICLFNYWLQTDSAAPCGNAETSQFKNLLKISGIKFGGACPPHVTYALPTIHYQYAQARLNDLTSGRCPEMAMKAHIPTRQD